MPHIDHTHKNTCTYTYIRDVYKYMYIIHYTSKYIDCKHQQMNNKHNNLLDSVTSHTTNIYYGYHNSIIIM